MVSFRDCGLRIIRVRFRRPAGPLNPVTVDARTLRTNYNVLDNHSGAKELWLRSGFQWDITNNVSLRSQVYGYDAHRSWFNNEYNTFNDSPTPSLGAQGEIYRERLALDHAQRLYGNVTDLTIDSNIGGMDNRFVTTVAASSLQFDVSQDTVFGAPIRSHWSIRTVGSTARNSTKRSTPTSITSLSRSRTG